jgi:hypothetical protein
MNIVSRSGSEITADITMITRQLGLNFRNTYRATKRVLENTDTRFVQEIRQTSQDSASNNSIKNQRAVRFAQEVVIDGNTYTYIRIYSINDVNSRGVVTQNTFERNAAPANIENMQLILRAARSR